jgi:hypothetical protein
LRLSSISDVASESFILSFLDAPPILHILHIVSCTQLKFGQRAAFFGRSCFVDWLVAALTLLLYLELRVRTYIAS